MSRARRFPILLLFILLTKILSLQFTSLDHHNFGMVLSNIFKYKSNIYIILGTNDSSLVDSFLGQLKSEKIAVGFNMGDAANGYILIGDNIETTKRILQTTTFIVQRTILLVHFSDQISTPANWDDFNKEPFQTLVNLKGLDIIVAACMYNVTSKWDIRQIQAIQTRSLRHGTQVHEKLTAWQPNFETHSKIFKVIAFDCRPYVYFDTKKGFYSGFDKFMLELIMELTKWPWAYDPRPPGYQISALKELQDHKSDACICSQLQAPIINYGIDQTIGYLEACITFLVRKPDLLPLETLAFQPLQLPVWLILLLMVVLISGVYNLRHDNYAETTSRILQLMIGSSNSTFPAATFLRILVLTTSLCGILLTTFFLASYSSILSQPRYDKPIETLQELIDMNFTWGEPTCATYTLLEAVTNEKLQPLLSKFRLFQHTEERNVHLGEKGFGMTVHLLGSQLTGKTDSLTEETKQKLMLLKDCYSNMFMVLPLTKNSPFKEILDEKITLLREHGFITHFFVKTMLDNYKVSRANHWFFTPYSRDYEYFDLTLQSQAGVFELWIAGLSISFIVFLLELCLVGRL